MKIDVDTHTHTTASIHAYSTLQELVIGAKKNRLKGIVISDHGPALQGGPHPFYFGNLQVLPHKIKGIHVFRGVELNIMNSSGEVDLIPKYIRNLDFVMSGFHDPCFLPSTKESNTQAMLAAIKNPFVDAISHPGNGVFQIDFEPVVETAKKYGKILEINNSSFKSRKNSNENCRTLAKLCAENGNLISISSDAHYYTDVGNLKTAISVAKEAGIDKKNVVNHNLEGFIDYITRRKAERSSL
ncbi:MAG: phosphatase [Termitinemataceae bacterium]|nr:MAG: phosphatase [Termitinemataceae bacterium]